MDALIDPQPWPPCPGPFNLARHVLEASTARLPDKSALQILRPAGAERWSYARLEAAVRGAGTLLHAQGMKPGAKVLLRVGHSVDFPILFLGAIAAGYVPIATSAALTTPEITRIADQVDPELVLAAPDIALPRHLTCPILSTTPWRAYDSHPPCAWDMGDPDRLAYGVLTSGTGGTPRLVGHAHRAVWARGMMHQGWQGLTEADRLLHAGALNWTYTLGTGLLDPWTVGATALIPAEGVAPAQLALLLKRFDATIFAGVPGLFRQMLRAPIPDLPRLRHGLSAGEQMPNGTRTDWEQATGAPIHEALGMTEISTFVSGSPERPAPPGTAGYAQPGRRVAVLDPRGLIVPRGGPGELAIDARDPGLMLGYLNDPQATAARLRDGWFLTGDLARMAEDGAITYLGRTDDQINAGGFRVSPSEVEEAMTRLPGVHDAAATEFEVKPGTRVIALAYAGPAPLPDDHLAAHAETCLARWKQPRLWLWMETLPRGAHGKINRRALAGAFARAQGLPPAGDTTASPPPPTH